MAEKDLTEKILLNYNDVFADIINSLLFNGSEEVKPSALENRLVHSQYKADDGHLHEEERDVFKVWRKYGVEIALCGLENQTSSYKYMPARVIGYDGAGYREQLLNDGEKSIVPVITLVLYFGTEHWNQPRSLRELFGSYPKELDEYVNDYKIHVFEVSWFEDDVIERFTSDFKVVARFFSDKRKYGDDYIPKDPTVIKHVDAVLKLLSVMTHDHRFEEIVFTEEERRNADMCAVVDKLVGIGEARGEARGEAKGRAEERSDNIRKFAAHLMKQNPDLSKEEVVEEARKIIR